MAQAFQRVQPLEQGRAALHTRLPVPYRMGSTGFCGRPSRTAAEALTPRHPRQLRMGGRRRRIARACRNTSCPSIVSCADRWLRLNKGCLNCPSNSFIDQARYGGLRRIQAASRFLEGPPYPSPRQRPPATYRKVVMASIAVRTNLE